MFKIMLIQRLAVAFIVVVFPVSVSWASGAWERNGNFYFLTKNTRDSFSAPAAGANKFPTKYLSYDGVDFLVRGADGWKDYGRLNLEGNRIFALPIRSGMKLEEVHFLASGNYGNSYEHDQLLHFYGDNYYYSVVTVLFAYMDGSYESRSVPVFWDWFHLPPVTWSKDEAKIRSIGSNPVRKDCSMYHINVLNPKPTVPVKDVLVTDSWVSDRPFSEIFAVTIKSPDEMDASPKTDRRFQIPARSAGSGPADTRTQWAFDHDLDGWAAGASDNWGTDAAWLADSYGRQGVIIIPACAWGGDKFSWIEKKVTLPAWDRITMQFSRHSAVFSELEKTWSDGLLKVIVQSSAGPETVYEKLFNGDWSREEVDLSKYKGQTVIIRFENHGAGRVHLQASTSPVCDAEDAILDDIRLVRGQ